MGRSLVNGFYFLLAIFLILFTLSSCNTTKKVKYFQDIPDSGAIKNFVKAPYTPLVIRAGDILSINIQTDDPLSAAGSIGSQSTSAGASSPVSVGGASAILPALGGNASAQVPQSGIPVDINGDITMPIIGRVGAAGYTIAQLTDTISKKAARYFKNPVVVIKIVNFKVDVTGEVARPGQYTMPEEKENIMDVLAMAGDLTVFGKRENVLLVRENPDGTKTSYRINLKKSDIFSSPLYYVCPNDVIYVEPRSAKSDANDAAQVRYVGIASAILGLIIIIATRININ